MITDVLSEIGHSWGKGGRTSCPIHGGTNETAFAYKDHSFVCFNCGEHGGEKKLREKLGLLPDKIVAPRSAPGPIPEGLEAYAEINPYFPPHAQRPSTRLAEAHKEWSTDLRYWAMQWHCDALAIFDRKLEPGLDPEDAFALLSAARHLRDAAHDVFRLFNEDECDCEQIDKLLASA